MKIHFKYSKLFSCPKRQSLWDPENKSFHGEEKTFRKKEAE